MKNRGPIGYLVISAIMIVAFLAGGSPRADDLQSWDQILTNKRFEVLMRFNDEAVLDRETQLVWEKTVSTTTESWTSARNTCANKVVGDRMGWRLPTFNELASLVDPTILGIGLFNPALPSGHPFMDMQGQATWTATTHALNNDFAWHVNFGVPDLSVSSKQGATLRVWCVRGGSVATDAY